MLRPDVSATRPAKWPRPAAGDAVAGRPEAGAAVGEGPAADPAEQAAARTTIIAAETCGKPAHLLRGVRAQAIVGRGPRGDGGPLPRLIACPLPIEGSSLRTPLRPFRPGNLSLLHALHGVDHEVGVAVRGVVAALLGDDVPRVRYEGGEVRWAACHARQDRSEIPQTKINLPDGKISCELLESPGGRPIPGSWKAGPTDIRSGSRS